MSFQSLGLRAELIRAVEEKGYHQPSPIQQQAIPEILQGNDLMGGAQTGTGKTAGFTLPLLQRLMTSHQGKGRQPLRALVLTPTRELASQVHESIEAYSRYLPLKATVVFGGVNINPQKTRLKQGVDVLVATPGRLLDHVSQHTVDLSGIEILVLDEADRMLDMGFIRDINRIMSLLPRQRQTLLFSATFSADIKKLAKELLINPRLVQVNPENATTEQVEQVVHPVDKSRKRELLSYLIGAGNWRQVLVFHRTKHGANRLAEQLSKDGLSASAIHGNKSQGARTKALADFKSGKIRVLVATDIAARGLDIKQLPHVVNYELPNKPEDYVHRIGRTGRAGHEGGAMSLVCNEEVELLEGIEKLTGKAIPRRVIPGHEPAQPLVAGQARKKSPAKNPARTRNGKKKRPSNQASRQSGNRNRTRSSNASANAL